MSESASYSMPVTHGMAFPAAKHEAQHAPLDFKLPQYFTFGRRDWFTAGSIGIQAALLLASGIFLLTQISATPNLAVQMGVLGGLLVAGGVAQLMRASGRLVVSLSVDDGSVNVRTGWLGYRLPWSEIEAWQVADHKQHPSEKPGISFWAYGTEAPLTIADGYLNDKDRWHLTHLFRSIEPGKEQK